MIKLFFKSLLLIPILLGMMYVSYKIDPSGLFFGSGFERLASEYMLAGDYINGYERLDGRLLNETYAKNIPEAPQILINGSSRSMMVTKNISPTKTFYNAGNVGGDIYDFYTSYYIFSKENKIPEIVILSVEPWIFNRDEEAYDKRSNRELYKEFLSEELGFDNDEYEKTDPNERYLALLDPSYFQGSVKYYNRDKSAEVEPEIVPIEEIYEQKEVIKSPDGSIIYDQKFRELTPDVVDYLAQLSATVPVFRNNEYTELDSNYVLYFETFVKYLQDNGVKPIIFLSPFHPIVYQAVLDQEDIFPGYLMAEEYVTEFAKENNIELYGSYNPEKIGLTSEDFYDGLHIRAETVEKILPIIE